jgi:hypothetical protein
MVLGCMTCGEKGLFLLAIYFQYRSDRELVSNRSQELITSDSTDPLYKQVTPLKLLCDN